MTQLALNTKKFVPSPQQAGFFSFITDGTGSCVLEAVAGAGKTTTLVKALALMEGTIFFGAYNKKIAVEIQSKAPLKDGLVISTMHAAGLAAWKKVCKYPQVDGDKVRNIYRAACERNMQYATFQGVVQQLVGLAKQAGLGIDGFPEIKSRASWITLIDHFDVETFDENSDTDNTDLIIKLAIKTLEASIAQNMKIIDFDDMIYAPLYHNVGFDKFDWVLVDEAQDTNATRRAMALRMMKPTSRLIAVGDRHQAIYQFQGADSDSLDLIATATKAIRLPLTTTFRCPKAVVRHAHQWVSHIQAAESAPEGIVREASIERFKDEVKPGDAVLCRYNAPLIKYVYQLIGEGIPAKVEGREIGKGIKTLAMKWKVKSLDALEEKLEKFFERESKKLIARDQEAKISQVEDRVNCLRVFIQRARSIDRHTKDPVKLICAEIDKVFSDDLEAAVVLLSSIHRSKGREWAKVVWLTTPPNKRARKDWQIEAESNLSYVATTRAMHELVLIAVPDEKRSTS